MMIPNGIIAKIDSMPMVNAFNRVVFLASGVPLLCEDCACGDSMSIP